MKYTPDEGRFVGQMGYGYRSIECFVAAVARIAAGAATAREFDRSLASVHATFQTTAILDAGRKSLDAGGMPMTLQYAEGGADPHAALLPVAIKPAF
jgi:D-galacturonate reductase